MRKLIAIFLLLFSLGAFADDTATVQAAVSAGTIIKGSYIVSSTITINHSFNGNGSTITYSGTGKCFSITAANIKVQKFNLVGPGDTTDPNGVSGIVVGVFDNDTVSFCHISAFPHSGIVGTNGNTPVVSDCNIWDTGYIGLFYINSVAITGGEIARDTIDRSMISASQGTGVTQGCLQLKGGVGAFATGWYVHDCRLIQSSNPADFTAECCESNKTPWVRFVNVTCIGGSIGLSIVGGVTHAVLSNCTSSGQNAEAFEMGNPNSKIINCTVSSGLHDGILFDGTTSADTLSNVTIGGCARYCVYVIQSSNSLFFTGGTYTSASANPNIELSTGYGITLLNTNLLGASTGNYAFELNNSTGNISANGGTISHFTAKLFHYTTGTSATADNISLRGMTYTSMTLSQDIFGSYTLGSNINYNLPAFTTGKLVLRGGRLNIKH